MPQSLPAEAPPSKAAQLVQGVIHLVSLPEVCLRIVEMVADPECTAEQLEEVISQDPALAARLLRVVNSPLYQAPRRIETLSRAVMRLGFRELKDLVLATSAAGTFDRIPSELANMDRFWRHAVLTGLTAQAVAAAHAVLHPERLFVAGLLHDIGRLVIFYRLPDAARQALELEAAGMEPDVAERTVMGLDHAQVGGELARAWGFSTAHQETAFHHHRPRGAGDGVLDAVIVHVADRLTRAVDENQRIETALAALDPEAHRLLDLDAERCREWLLEVHKRFVHVVYIFRPSLHA